MDSVRSQVVGIVTAAIYVLKKLKGETREMWVIVNRRPNVFALPAILYFGV